MSKKRKFGKCNLCLKENWLCKSHIYPKAFVNHLRDKKVDNIFLVLSDIILKKSKQDGPKEYLLCEKCETHIKLYEDYYKEFFIDKKNISLKQIENGLIHISGYNYKKLRLFLLSVLWRTSITSLENWHIELSTIDQELLRNAILNDIPGSYDFFPFYTFLIQIDGHNESSFFMNPFDSNVPIDNCVFMYIFGVLYMFSKTSINERFTQLNSLTREKWICNIKNIKEVPILLEKIKSINIDKS